MQGSFRNAIPERAKFWQVDWW